MTQKPHGDIWLSGLLYAAIAVIAILLVVGGLVSPPDYVAPLD